MYRMRFYQDSYEKGAKATLYGQHSLIYVLEGAVKINGEAFEGDTEKDEIAEEVFYFAKSHSAAYADGCAEIEALEDSVVWRWEIDRTEEKPDIAVGEGIASIMKMERAVRSYELAPGRECLFSLDSVIFQGGTGLHTNQGSGIRCLRSGAVMCRSMWGESSDNVGRGAAWYEEATYPVRDFPPEEDGIAAMMRGMITTADYYGKAAGSYCLDNGGARLECRATCVAYIGAVIKLR